MISSQRKDPGNMFGAIYDFPGQMQQAIEIGERIELNNTYENIRNIVVAGMGGSAIGGDVVRMLIKDDLNIPFVVSRNYTLPNWVNENTLVICSSYSGNTEETLSAYEEAQAKKAQICGISTGGVLSEKLNAAGLDLVSIPAGLQPRAALAFSFIPMLFLLQKIGLIGDGFRVGLESAIETLSVEREKYSVEDEKNPTYKLARKIYNTIPIIYGEADSTAIIACRWKGQFCENAKMLAYANELPEMNHNEIVGWENNASLFSDLSVIWLVDESNHPRVSLRQKVTQSILQDLVPRQQTVSFTGNNRIERLIHQIHFGDWVSYWCAMAHNTDPSPVKKIDLLKNELKKHE